MPTINSGQVVTLAMVYKVLKRLGGFGSIPITEFTHGGRRVDCLLVDIYTRWARGFEVKMTRADYLRDEKWQDYAMFCSSLSIACPADLIQKDEVPHPFGLLWVSVNERGDVQGRWVKKPKKFQRREGLAWLYTYVSILEKELPRLVLEIEQLQDRLESHLTAPTRG